MSEDRRTLPKMTDSVLMSTFKEMVAREDRFIKDAMKPKYVYCPTCQKSAEIFDSEIDWGHTFRVPCYHCNISHTVDRTYIKNNRTTDEPVPVEPPKPQYPSFGPCHRFPPYIDDCKHCDGNGFIGKFDPVTHEPDQDDCTFCIDGKIDLLEVMNNVIKEMV